jgi:hypothetical protein
LIKDLLEMEESVSAARAAQAAAKEAFERAESDLRVWVYKMNNVEPDDPATEKANRKAYVNRLDNVRAKKPREDEEGEEDVEAVVDEEDFKRRKKRRKRKWEWRKEEEYNRLLKRALELAQPSLPGVLGKLKTAMTSQTYPAPYQAVIDARERMTETQVTVSTLLSDIANAKERLAMDVGPDHIWFDATERSISGPVSGTDRTVVIEYFRRAQLRLPSMGCAKLISLGMFRGRGENTMEFHPGDVEEDGKHLSMTVRFVCYPEEKLMGATAPSISRVVALVGLPEACNPTFSEQDFETFLQEVSPYWEHFNDVNL